MGDTSHRGPAVSGTTWKFAGLEFFFWSSVVALEAFLVPYLTTIGLGSSAAGIVMSSIFLGGIVSAPLWGAFCDAGSRHRFVMLLSFAVGAVAVLLIPVAGARLLPVFVLGLAYSATANAMPGILDSWIMHTRRSDKGVQYGLARGFGSAGFALGGLALGRLIDATSLGIMFPYYTVVVGLAAIMALRISRSHTPPPGPEAVETRVAGDAEDDAPVHAVADRPVVSQTPHISGGAVKAMLTSVPYMVFLAMSLLIFIQLRAAITFLPLLIYEAGGSSTMVGLAQMVGAGGEIPFMFASVLLLKWFRPRALLLFSMAMFILRIGLLGWIHSPEGLVAAQALHGLSFGVFLPVSIHYIDRIAPRRYATVFQTTATSVHFGIGSVIGSSLSGIIVSAIGLRAMYRLLGFPVILATLGFAVFLFIDTRSPGRRRTERTTHDLR